MRGAQKKYVIARVSVAFPWRKAGSGSSSDMFEYNEYLRSSRAPTLLFYFCIIMETPDDYERLFLVKAWHRFRRSPGRVLTRATYVLLLNTDITIAYSGGDPLTSKYFYIVSVRNDLHAPLT